MLSTVTLAALWAAAATPWVLALPTWPSTIDELEDIMFLNTGHNSRGFSAKVTPCSSSEHGPSRIASAEWLRTAFHDMATGNVFTGVGGLDASLVFELGGNGGENIGPAFKTTLQTFTPFFSSRASMADLIALGVYTSVRSCGGPIVKIRAGRVDATSRGPVGVPLPENSQRTFINQFARTGFNISDMIAVTACGHTMGGVHAADFPQIVIPGKVPHDYQLLDSTPHFDEKIATNFITGDNSNPLTGATAKANTRDADTKVFTADSNLTITALADPATFRSTCARVLQKMIEVVPSKVTLTDPIEPYEVKPGELQLSLAGNGSVINFSGHVRVRTTGRSANSIAAVKLLYKDRSGGSNCGSCTIETEYKGAAAGFDDTFAFYEFTTIVSVATSISNFVVRVTLTTGNEELYDNNGSGYPVQDTIMLQSRQSCITSGSNGELTVVAAVRDTVASPTVSLSLTTTVPRSCCVVPALTKASATMTKGASVGPYTFYSGNYTLDPALKSSSKFDVSVSGGGDLIADTFKSTANLGPTCVPFGSENSTLPERSYSGCFTDNVASRALTGAAFQDNQLTIDKCAALCESYQFFGLEYGRECFCGNTQSSSSSRVEHSECNAPCSGDVSEVCGAPDRLSLYKNLAWVPTLNPNITGYIYYGCHSDSPRDRALSERFVYDVRMTVEKCASFCNGTTYFGVEYYSECYCGASLSQSSTIRPETDCGFFCSGNSTQYCGGSGRINLYQRSNVTLSNLAVV